jgi:heme-degrading monooxygenase HmoA
MMVVVFRARRTLAGVGEDYQHWFTRMTELARNMPGYVSHKAYVAERRRAVDAFRMGIGNHAAGMGHAS